MLTTDQLLGKGRYRIISNFTQDDSGGLYEAYDTVSNTNVVLRETVGSGGGVMTPTQLDAINDAFAGEAKVLSEIRHESLLSVQDYFSEIDRHYLVMESVDGCDLTRFLQPDENKPALRDMVKWADQILDALHYLHSLPTSLVHRDVRPANIRLTSSFKVKLLTAGIDAGDLIMASAVNPVDSSVLNYRPLEQLWGGLDPASQKVISNHYDERSRRILQQPLDARSDIYSVGATLYHVMTRTLPKDALERSIEILDGNSDPLVPPADLDASIPEEISEVIIKAMELRREHRYDSAAIMRQVLDAAQKQVTARKTGASTIKPAPEPLPADEIAKTEEKNKPEAQDNSSNDRDLQRAAAAELEQEKQRSEVRRGEIRADLERQQKEAERLNAMAREEEARRATTEPTTDDQFLLEVEPVVPSSDSFEWSADISDQPARTHHKTYSSRSDDIDFNIEPASGSTAKVMAAGAGGLLMVLAVAGWFMFGGSAPVETPKAEIPAVEQNASQQQDTAPVSPYGDANANYSVEQNSDPAQQSNVAAASDINNLPATAQTKQKKAAPTPAKTVEKKKVTVDDLINDN